MDCTRSVAVRQPRVFTCVTVIAAAFLISATAVSARADSYPQRPITMIVPFAPGGAADINGRIIGDALSKRLGQPIIVENVGGAGGAIGTARVKNANADGYTVGLGHTGTLAAAVGTTANLAYDPRKDFSYLGLVSRTPNVVFVGKDSPAKDLKEFIALARQKGSALQIGHSGIGSASYITCVQFFQLIGTKPTLVPYRGFGLTVNDIMAGNIDGSCDLVVSVSSFVAAGTIRALAVAADERAPAIPDVPTAAEAGLPDFKVDTWTGLFVPKQTPQPIVETLQNALSAVLEEPEVQARLAKIGAAVPKPEHRGGDYMQKLVVSEVDRWVSILQKAGVTPQ